MTLFSAVNSRIIWSFLDGDGTASTRPFYIDPAKMFSDFHPLRDSLSPVKLVVEKAGLQLVVTIVWTIIPTFRQHTMNYTVGVGHPFEKWFETWLIAQRLVDIA